jgi:gliding motility-associated-like protein
MKYKYIILLIGFFALYTTGVYSQPHNPFFRAVKAQNVTKGDDINKLMHRAAEVPSKRTLFSSTYKTKDGKIVCKYSTHLMNYPDANGKLQPINIELHSDAKGWVVDQQPTPCYFHSDRSTGISLGKGGEFDFNINSSVNGSIYDESINSLTKDVVSLDLTTSIHKTITFAPSTIETDYMLDNSIGTEVTISEEVKYPSGYKIIRDKIRGRESAKGWCGDYILVSGFNNTEAARFHAPLCYDSKENWCIGSYSIIVKDGKTILTTSVPSEWLSKAVYPIVVDPEVTTTSEWTGGNIPSCVFPSFSTDSILITIPPKVTINDFFIDYAYETNENTPVYLPDGKFYFSTPCRNNIHDTLSCDNEVSEETQSGYCYLDPGTDFHCFLTSCSSLNPSCDSISFYLTQHLARLSGGTGCDTDWVWYTKYLEEPYYQFGATIVGSTIQPDSINPIVITPTSQCSNICSLNMKVNVNYGVPPYKISHPWDTTSYSVGTYSAADNCTTTGTANFTLKIPGCPTLCGKNDTIIVPPPFAIDACGDTATGWPVETVIIKPTPVITSTPDTLAVCNGEPLKFTLNSCVSGTTFSWTGTNGSSGNGNINNTALDSSSSISYTVIYTALGNANGCLSDTIKGTGIVYPYLSPTIIGLDSIPLGTSDNLSAGGGIKYSWKPSTGLSCDNCPNPIATPSATTVYTVTITNIGGCTRTDSIRILVIDEKLGIPNVLTPNNAGPLGLNNIFYITNLQYYPNSNLQIFDRWGVQVFNTTDYLNNWNGGNQSDGVYYYVLTLNTGTKYKGFFQIIK